MRTAPPAPAAETPAAHTPEHPAPAPARRIGSRRTFAAVLGALATLTALAVLTQWLALTPYIDATWRQEGPDYFELSASPLAQLQSGIGKQLLGIGGAGGSEIAPAIVSPSAMPRWVPSDARREALTQAQRDLAIALTQGSVRMRFDGIGTVDVPVQPRGLAGLGPLYWLMAAMALALCVAGAAVFGAMRGVRNAPYFALTIVQAGAVLLTGIQGMPGLGQPIAIATHAAQWHAALDLFAVAGVLQLATMPPLRVPHRRMFVALTWAVALLVAATVSARGLAHAWWWLQGTCVGIGVVIVLLCTRSYAAEPNPYALLARRLVLIGLAAFALLTLAVVASAERPGLLVEVAAVGPTVWALFFALVLLMMPRLWRSQPLMREFSMFSTVSMAAMALDLLLVGVLGMDPVASLSLAAFAALGLYAAIRQRQLTRAVEQQMADAGRRVDRLYRGVREVEAHPQRADALTQELLRDLFAPLEMHGAGRGLTRARVVAEGAALHVPLPAAEGANATSLTLRFAERGTRLFTREDARLADQVVEQLRRALAQERAVERGRSEERARIAQDLHDDIGARLLTLMYQAPTREMEDYIRHTLKDLKTLTRGLASAEHRLSHATAEWKADITQRLQAARVELDWSFEFDRDIALSVVQWSALTRVLRELVSNVIQHSAATHVTLSAQLRDGALRLHLADNGVGRAPQAWAHGLGLGGVRKRVKLLGGEVHWADNDPAGIACTVVVPRLAPPGA